jgi:F-type H+-transporting ATPase subunit b
MAESTSAHTEAPSGGHKEPFPPFNKETYASQLFWLVLTFVALYVVLSRLALPRIEGIIEGRRSRIAGDLAEAQRLKQESEAATAAYQKVLADARANAQGIAGKARDTMMAEADARRKVTEDDLNKKLEAAEKTISTTKTAAMANVKSIATDAAAAIVQQLIGKAPSEKAVSDAVADVLKG